MKRVILMGKAHFGICCVCGAKRNMTFEHIPPRKANNTRQVKSIIDPIGFFENNQKFEDKIKTIKYKLGNQKGMGGYTLCSNCNSFFGSNYATEFIPFYNELSHFFANNYNDIISKSHNGYLDIDIQANINFFRFQKQVVSMLMSTSNGMYKKYFEDYLLNEQNNDFPNKKFKIIMNGYLDFNLSRQTGQMIGANFSGGTEIVGSEIQVFPLGFTLVELNGSNKEKDIKVGVNITEWAKLGDYQQKLGFSLRTYTNSQPFPYYITGVTLQ